ncbi:MAG: hypothetical protein ACR2RE_04500 [Geminicoccaceae bacterium]
MILLAIFIGLLVLAVLYLMKHSGSAKKPRAYKHIHLLVAIEAWGAFLIIIAAALLLVVELFY